MHSRRSASAAQLEPAAPAAPEELQQTLGSLQRRPIKYQFEGHKHPSRRNIAVAARLATEAIRGSGRMTGDQYNETSQLILQHHATGAEKVRRLQSASRLCEPLGKHFTSSQRPRMPSSVVLPCCMPARILGCPGSWTAHNQLQQPGMQRTVKMLACPVYSCDAAALRTLLPSVC